MGERDGEGLDPPGTAGDLAAVEGRLSELQERKRKTVRWHMSRSTAERAIAAITGNQPRSIGPGKSRRRKRYKRLL